MTESSPLFIIEVVVIVVVVTLSSLDGVLIWFH
jgi:hypothetical protein